MEDVDSPSIVMGQSRGYSPPEQFHPRIPCTASDQYPLAVMVYEAFTGQRPFHITRIPGANPEPLVRKIQGISDKKVQKDIQDAVFKALAYYPRDRHENVKTFAEELEKACFGRIRKQRPPRDRLQKLYQDIAAYDEAIHLNPRNVDAHYNKGNALSELRA